ncbi:MAG: hydroxylamine reductase, partial [bacterium]|nr:hydroxylamine reductase [bacterium]
MNEKMFCRQCEQTVMTKACTIAGVCGKSPEAAVLMDKIIYALQGIAVYGYKLREKAIVFEEVDRHLIEALFTTVTNVNFDTDRLKELLYVSSSFLEKVKTSFIKEFPQYDISLLPKPAHWKIDELNFNNFDNSLKAGIFNGFDEDVRSLKEILLYGMKGMAAYADHAWILGTRSEKVTSFFYKGLSSIAETSISSEALINLILECGSTNLECMEMLDRAHTTRFGNPVPTKVFLGAKKGYAIVVSGHDLLDLHILLKQTEDTGINIYTHGETVSYTHL